MTFRSTLLICLLAVSALSCGLFLNELPEDERISIRHNERERKAVVHYPKNTEENKPVPLLVVFHGAGGSGLNFQRESGLDKFADWYGFAVAYPNATGFNWAEGCNCIRP